MPCEQVVSPPQLRIHSRKRFRGTDLHYKHLAHRQNQLLVALGRKSADMCWDENQLLVALARISKGQRRKSAEQMWTTTVHREAAYT